MLGRGPQKEKVADVEPWINKVVKADFALVVPITDWITVSAEGQGSIPVTDTSLTEQ